MITLKEIIDAGEFLEQGVSIIDEVTTQPKGHWMLGETQFPHLQDPLTVSNVKVNKGKTSIDKFYVAIPVKLRRIAIRFVVCEGKDLYGVATVSIYDAHMNQTFSTSTGAINGLHTLNSRSVEVETEKARIKISVADTFTQEVWEEKRGITEPLETEQLIFKIEDLTEVQYMLKKAEFNTLWKGPKYGDARSWGQRELSEYIDKRRI